MTNIAPMEKRWKVFFAISLVFASLYLLIQNSALSDARPITDAASSTIEPASAILATASVSQGEATEGTGSDADKTQVDASSSDDEEGSGDEEGAADEGDSDSDDAAAEDKAEKKKAKTEFEIAINLTFGLIGGLGIFLLGMKNMSDGVQGVAGNSLRRMISFITTNRFSSVIVGVLITAFVQSSSVSTVMVVGFVNSGVMTLGQAIGVIMGANIGTTITGCILTFKIGKYGLPLLGVGAIWFLFSRKDRARYFAMTVLGVGMVFFGLELMKDSCSFIHDLPAFEAWFRTFQATSPGGIIKCMLAGCVLTMMVQSSSATLGITMALAISGTITYETAAALVLGENLGTTVTAFLASVGATTNAKRAAYFHVIFNIIGVAWAFIIFSWYVKLIPWLVSAEVTKPLIENGVTTYPDTFKAIAATHMIFNIANTTLLVWFVPLFAKLMLRLVPAKNHKEKPHLTNLDVRLLDTPAIAIEQSRVELIRMGEGCQKMMGWMRELLTQPEPEKESVAKLFNREEILDAIQDEVVVFTTSLLAGNVSHDVISEARQQIRIADEYESISDYVRSILKFRLKLDTQGFGFSKTQQDELLEVHDLVSDYLDLVVTSYTSVDRDLLTKAATKSGLIKHRLKTLRDDHITSLSVETVEPFVSVAYTSTLNSYRRVRDHAENVAETIAGEK